MNADAAFSQAEKHLAAGEFDQTLSICRSLVEEKIHDPRSYLMLGLVAHKKGDDTSALRLWSQGSALFPNDPALHFNIAAMFVGHNSHKLEAQSRERLRKAVELRPDWVEAWFLLGQVCHHIGPGHEAVASLRRVIELAPDHLAARKLLAQVSANSGNLEESKAQLDYVLANLENADTRLVKDAADAATPKRPSRAKMILAHYPEDCAAMRNNLRQVAMDYVLPGHLEAGRFIGPQTRFFTLGSCFARHISAALMRAGQNVYRMALDENINTTFANRYFMEWLSGRQIDSDVKERIEELAAHAGADIDATLGALTAADAVILTLGVAPCFFERGTQKFIMPRPSAINRRALAERYEFRTTSVAENVDNLLALIDAIRSINASVRIFLTLSPVPLHTSFEFESAVAADCLSKSVLRVAAGEVIARKIDGIHYWPSFEIVRWLAAHAYPTYGADDNSAFHVNEDIISMIIDLFIDSHRA